jgi:YD repeat-containing protein
MTTTRQYDNLNRLTTIATLDAQLATINSYDYGNNDANQRVRVNLPDASFWLYEYDSLGQVKSGKRYWSDWTPVAGQQFEYTHDDIGNRTATKAGGDENGANLRSASYAANNLNQYTNRSVPGAVDVMGVAYATNNVTVNGVVAYRRVEYFRREVPTNNASVPVWVGLTVSSAGSNVTGNVFVPKTPELFTYDADGNQLADGRWNYTWDAENRLIVSVVNTAVGPQQYLAFEYDCQGRRIGKKIWNNTTGNGQPATTWKFVSDGWNLVAALNGSAALQQSAWADCWRRRT